MEPPGNNRPPGRLIAAVVVVIAATAALCAVGASNLADRHWLTGAFALLIAAGFVAALMVIRALLHLNRVLIHQNARLLYVLTEPSEAEEVAP